MTDFPHLFCHFLLFHFSISSHLGSSVSPPLASFSHLSPVYSLASSRQQDSVSHSGPLGPWLSPPLFATTQSVIPAHSVYGVFFSLSCLGAAWAQSVIPAHSVPCCLCISFHFSSLCFSTTALTQSVIPAHSVFGNFLALPCLCPPPFSFGYPYT